MLKYRLISAVLLIPTIIAALFLLPPIGFSIIVLAVCMLAAWEWGKLSFFTSFVQRIWLVILCGFLLAIMFFELPNHHHNSYQPLIASFLLWVSLGWWVAALFLVLFYPSSAVIWYSFKLSRLMFGLFIIVPFFWSVLVLRAWHYADNHYSGIFWLLYVMILVWGADSGAYIFGKLFGKHKLAPKVSPNKTWQGFIGGLVTTTIISWSYEIYVNLEISVITLLICSVFTSLASVLGDLTESMFKREAQIKDSGYLIPGHGGILDCLDSLTAAIPVFTFLLLLVFRQI